MTPKIFFSTLLLSSFLLGWLELLVGRRVLPAMGGAAPVWNTTLLFFQLVVLVGYGFAHLLAQRAGPRARRAWHLLLPVGALGALVAQLQPSPPASDAGTLAIVGALVAALAIPAGLPALALSATSPAVQRWLVTSGHPSGRDPYFLYAAGNVGMLAGLAVPPLVFDRVLPLGVQDSVWRALFVVLVAMVGWCASRAGLETAEPTQQAEAGAPSARDRLGWAALSFLPCSLLHGVTTTVTTDAAAVPLLWAIPLLLYFGTFAAAYRPGASREEGRWVQWLPVLLVVDGVLALAGAPLPTALLLPIHFAAFGLTALALHQRLAAARPSPRHLTGYYLWIAVGGALGGVLNTLVAPGLFDTALEYPAVLALAGVLLAAGRAEPLQTGARRLLQFTIGIGLVFALAGFKRPDSWTTLVTLALFGGLIWALRRAFVLPRGAIAATALVLLLIERFSILAAGVPVVALRSWFGVHRVVRDERAGWVGYVHGTTLHGRQYLDPARANEPLAYFHAKGPVGSFMRHLESIGRPRRVTVVGLGVGSFAGWSRPGQAWEFIELDPIVVAIARDAGHFTHLARAPVPIRVATGDGRRVLEERAPASCDLLVLDAFSSDSVPVHLLTREAFALYASRLTDDGVLVLNVTNRFLDLEPQVAALAHVTGLTGVVAEDRGVPKGPASEGRLDSRWIVLAKAAAKAALPQTPEWTPLSPSGARAWSDDFTDLVSAVRWPKG